MKEVAAPETVQRAPEASISEPPVMLAGPGFTGDLGAAPPWQRAERRPGQPRSGRAASAPPPSGKPWTSAESRPLGRSSIDGSPLQLKADTAKAPTDPMGIARSGFTGTAGRLPDAGRIGASLGANLGSVKAYTGPEAAAACDALGAQAYTVGDSIAFKSQTPSLTLQAHEAAHTVQQGAVSARGPASGDGQEAVQRKSAGVFNSYEAEADAVAADVVAGHSAEVKMRTGPDVQMWGGPDHLMLGNTAGKKALSQFKPQTQGGPQPQTMDVDGMKNSGNKGQDPNGSKVGMELESAGKETTLAVSTGEGDNAQNHSFGELTRYSGDYVKTAQGLGEDGAMEVVGNGAFAAMVGIAATNSNHFYPVNQSEYRANHAKALKTAALAAQTQDKAKREQLFNQALQQEGFASHFLQDCHAAGHFAPRALDAVGHWFETVSESQLGLTRTKDWHDFFSMIPDGLPTTKGRFHGDYYMDGNDLDYVSNVAAQSLLAIMNTADHGTPDVAQPDLPHPNFGAIMADPMAGPAWQAMMGDYKADFESARDSVRGKDDGTTVYTTSGGTELVKGGKAQGKEDADETIDLIEKNVMGRTKGGSEATTDVGSTRARLSDTGKLDRLKTQISGLKNYLTMDFEANIYTREGDDGSLRSKKDPHFAPKKLEEKMGLLTELKITLTDWAAILEGGPEKQLAAQCLGMVNDWIASIDTWHRSAVSGQEVVTGLGQMQQKVVEADQLHQQTQSKKVHL